MASWTWRREWEWVHSHWNWDRIGKSHSFSRNVNLSAYVFQKIFRTKSFSAKYNWPKNTSCNWHFTLGVWLFVGEGGLRKWRNTLWQGWIQTPRITNPNRQAGEILYENPCRCGDFEIDRWGIFCNLHTILSVCCEELKDNVEILIAKQCFYFSKNCKF